MPLKIRNLLKHLQNRNFRYVFLRIISWIPHSLLAYDSFFFVRCERLNRGMSRKLPSPAAIFLSDFSREELHAVARDLPLAMDIVLFQAANRHPGDIKIVKIVEDGRCVAVTFLAVTGVLRSPSGYSFEMPEGRRVAWVFGTYVAEAYRLRAYFPALISATHEEAQRLGADAMMGEIHHQNIHSIKAHARLGFEVFKSIHYLKILNKRIFWEDVRGRHWYLPAPYGLAVGSSRLRGRGYDAVL